MWVTPTDLDQLLWWRRIESKTVEEVVASLRRKDQTNMAMALGIAWHDVMENPPADEFAAVIRNGFRFVIDCDITIPLAQLVESKLTGSYTVQGERVRMYGRADAINGLTVRDYKLSTKAPNPENYEASYQWRAYLDMANAMRFEYYCFQGKIEGKQRTPPAPGDDLIDVTITGCTPFAFYSYPNMRSDLLGGISDFMDFAREHVPERMSNDR